MVANKDKQKNSPKRIDSDGPHSRHMDKRKLKLVKKKGKTAKLKLNKGKAIEAAKKIKRQDSVPVKVKNLKPLRIEDVKSTMEK